MLASWKINAVRSGYFKTNVLYPPINSLRFKNTFSREVRIFNKLVMDKKAKKNHFLCGFKPKIGVASIINNPAVARTKSLRVSVLNKLFMNYVTDIMATGAMSHILLGRGIEVTQVSVSDDFNFMNIYWLAQSINDENVLESLLPKLALSLRHELNQLHLISTVPKIGFIRDVRHAKLAEIDRLIAAADKGNPDEVSDESESYDDNLPAMPMNVYGLEHDKIVSKIMKSSSRAKSLSVKEKFVKSENQSVSNISSIESEIASIYNEKATVKKFLMLKNLSRKRSYRKENKYPHHDVSLNIEQG